MSKIGEYIHAYAKNYLDHGTDRYGNKGANGLSEIENAVQKKKASATGLYNKAELELIKDGIQAALGVDTAEVNNKLKAATKEYLAKVVDPAHYDVHQAGAVAFSKAGDVNNLGRLIDGKLQTSKVRAKKNAESGRYVQPLLAKITICYNALAEIGSNALAGAANSAEIAAKVRNLQSNLREATDLIINASKGIEDGAAISAKASAIRNYCSGNNSNTQKAVDLLNDCIYELTRNGVVDSYIQGQIGEVVAYFGVMQGMGYAIETAKASIEQCLSGASTPRNAYTSNVIADYFLEDMETALKQTSTYTNVGVGDDDSFYISASGTAIKANITYFDPHLKQTVGASVKNHTNLSKVQIVRRDPFSLFIAKCSKCNRNK